MLVIKNESPAPFDVDGTLILHLKDNTGYRTVNVWDAVTKAYKVFAVHEPMVRLLLEEHHRGSYVIVWSRGGWQWAKNVIIALGLEDKVDLVMTKPLVYFDDKDVAYWLKYRVFLDPNENYKN